MKLSIASVCLALALAGAPSFAQVLPNADDVRDAVSSIAKDQGAARVIGEIRLRQVRHNGTVLMNLPVQPGQETIVAAACDQWCTDIDIVVFDEDGEVIKEDIANDDATVHLPASKQNAVIVELRMLKCAEDLCTAGVGAFGTASAADAARRSGEATLKTAQGLFGN